MPLPSIIANHPRALLIALCLLLYVPGMFALPPLDRDEARFVQASKQMVQSGDYVNIYFQDEPRHKKPIGIYWLHSVSATVFGEYTVSSYRLVSLLCAIGAVLSLFCWLRRYGDETRAFVAAALLAGTLGLTLEAHQAKTDAALLLAIITMQGSLLMHWQAGREERVALWVTVLYWFAVGCAVLIKGPVGLLVGGLTVFALCAIDRSIWLIWKLKPWFGAPLAALVVLPWLYAIQQETGGTFLTDGYAEDVLPKLFSGVESHGAPPGYYLLLLPVFFWPATLFLLPAIPVIWQARKDRLILFAVAWLLPSWIAIELIPTKLPHYVLPLYPALCVLVAFGIMQLKQEPKRLARAGLVLWALIALILCAALMVYPLHLKTDIPWHAFIMLAVGLGLLGLAMRSKARRLFAVLAFHLLILGYVFQFFLPSLEPMWISRQLNKTIQTLGEGYADALPVAITGYHEPSLVFLRKAEVRLTNLDGVVKTLDVIGAGAIGIVSEDQLDVFRQMVDERGIMVDEVGLVEGLNYSKGKFLKLYVFIAKGSC